MRITGLFILSCLFSACSGPTSQKTLFQEVKNSGIDFTNQVSNTEDFNIFSYRNFYNGGGVAIGDINNDGLADVYLTGNMSPNKLFLNKGNFEFEDITEKAGVAGTKAWSTGVVFVDINADNLLDIYVCNAGYVRGDDQENELFINNGDLTFTEQAADFNLDEGGYTTHAAFFDYDKDGDLDVYLLNNSFIPVNTLNYSNKRELRAEDWPVRDFLKGGGDKLLQNVEGQFYDVSEKAGIYGSLIGFGLGITIGDVNGDHWPDMYVSNDFFERDYLYINNQDGTFTEDIKNYMSHLSLSSMGADMADINNDGYPEIFVTEMLPDDEYRRKTVTLFENYNIYYLKLQRDFYHQYMQNTLQLNNKDGSFSEIAHYSGVAASDWSWGALMFDADNDGYRDLYICNGVYQDVTDQDFMDFFANEIVQQMALTGKKEEMENVIAKMPSQPIPNKVFKNSGDLSFEDIGRDWGFDKPTFSNGAAYGDLDNDGDLDLVINNLNQPSLVYKNQSQALNDHHHISISLKGDAANTYAIGAKVFVFAEGEILNMEMIPSRGFQSSIDYKMVFGLGQTAGIDSVMVIWPDQTQTTIPSPPLDELLEISYAETTPVPTATEKGASPDPVVQRKVAPFESHEEDPFVDFFQEGLTMRMLSREGPKAAVADVNGDGSQDVFIGGGNNQAARLYLLKGDQFEWSEQADFLRDSVFEDTEASFLDIDDDGDQDLFVGSGGNHLTMGARELQDRIYLNDGRGNFTLDPRALPANGLNTSVAVALDFDQDGDQDLFVGSRSTPNVYGISPFSYLYENDGKGRFKNVTRNKAPQLEKVGMVTDAALTDINGDGQTELIVVGEWMSPQVFQISKGGLQKYSSNISDFSGWWYAIQADDVDGDGDKDLILGNRGENFYFSGSAEAPAKLWVADFDDNGTMEKIITRHIKGKDMPVPLKKELTGQLTSLKKQNLKHADYAQKSIQELFEEAILEKALVKEGNYFKTAVAINNGKGQFSLKPLPAQVQFSCVCDIYCTDINGDQLNDIILGGNFEGFTPQFSKLDASFGHVLINKGQGRYERLENQESGFFVRGDIKEFQPITINGEAHILTLINQKKPQLFKIVKNQLH